FFATDCVFWSRPFRCATLISKRDKAPTPPARWKPGPNQVSLREEAEASGAWPSISRAWLELAPAGRLPGEALEEFAGDTANGLGEFFDALVDGIDADGFEFVEQRVGLLPLFAESGP